MDGLALCKKQLKKKKLKRKVVWALSFRVEKASDANPDLIFFVCKIETVLARIAVISPQNIPNVP
jgi:hypothetical protein